MRCAVCCFGLGSRARPCRGGIVPWEKPAQKMRPACHSRRRLFRPSWDANRSAGSTVTDAARGGLSTAHWRSALQGQEIFRGREQERAGRHWQNFMPHNIRRGDDRDRGHGRCGAMSEEDDRAFVSGFVRVGMDRLVQHWRGCEESHGEDMRGKQQRDETPAPRRHLGRLAGLRRASRA